MAEDSLMDELSPETAGKCQSVDTQDKQSSINSITRLHLIERRALEIISL